MFSVVLAVRVCLRPLATGNPKVSCVVRLEPSLDFKGQKVMLLKYFRVTNSWYSCYGKLLMYFCKICYNASTLVLEYFLLLIGHHQLMHTNKTSDKPPVAIATIHWSIIHRSHPRFNLSYSESLPIRTGNEFLLLLVSISQPPGHTSQFLFLCTANLYFFVLYQLYLASHIP